MPTTPRYRILDPIGRGRIGEIHLGEATDPDVKPRQVAVAMMDPRLTEHQPSFQLLQEQVEILERLRHPNIARTLELSWFLEGWGLVMEYARGLDLELYRLAGALPVRVVAEIVEQVSGALTAALELPLQGEDQPLGLVHGDLVPSLVRLDAQGGIKVCAFGLAAADGPDPSYAAPDCHEGGGSALGDVYSLGLIMARLLSGRDFQQPPRSAPAHKEFVAAILDAVSQQVRQEVPASMHQATEPVLLMLESMLDFEPRRRPSARRVQMGCRSMLGVLPGPWLQAWAQARVPDYYEKALEFARSRDPAAVRMPIDSAQPAATKAAAPAAAHPFFMDGSFEDDEDELPVLTPAMVSIEPDLDDEEDTSASVLDAEAVTGDVSDDEASSDVLLDDEESSTGGLEAPGAPPVPEPLLEPDVAAATGQAAAVQAGPQPESEVLLEEDSEEVSQDEPEEESVEEASQDEPEEESAEEAVEEEPVPTVDELEPAEVEPEPAEVEPEPLEDEPEPAEDEPEPLEDEPEPAEELAEDEPEPAEVELEPAEVELEPAEVELEPAEDEPEPAEVELEPAKDDLEPVEELAEDEPEPAEEPAEDEPEPAEDLAAAALEPLDDDDVEDVSEHLIDEGIGVIGEAPVELEPKEQPKVAPTPIPAPARPAATPPPALARKPQDKDGAPIPWWVFLFFLLAIIAVLLLWMKGLLGPTQLDVPLDGAPTTEVPASQPPVVEPPPAPEAVEVPDPAPAAAPPEPAAAPPPATPPAAPRAERPAPAAAPVAEPVPVAKPTPAAKPPPAAAPPPEPVPDAAPVPEPAADPKPAAKPVAASTAGGGTVSLEGDATKVLLQGDNGSFPLGSVPAGTYSISAWFGGDAPVPAGTVTVSEGQSVTLRCSSLMLRCSSD